MSTPAPTEPILHVDMDAFFAAVEARRDPSLAGKPVLVGGTGGRGVVASASYEARAYGIGSAMPMAAALRRCPHAVVLPPDFAAYTRASAELMEILRSVTPLVEPLSLDEAFCDVRGSVRLFGPPVVIGRLVRRRIADELGLVASVGVAPNKFLAKLCSDAAKPDGLRHLVAEDVRGFLDALPVGALWGVGAKTAERLSRFGIRGVAELAAVDEPTLARIVGAASGAHLARLARGEDPRPVVPHEPAKGMSAEETFDTDVDDLAVLRRELLALAERLSGRLRRGRVAARTVTLKLRYATFQTVTRSRTLEVPTAQATELHRAAVTLLDALRLERVRVRLLGLAATNLVPAEGARQLGLLAQDRWEDAEQAAEDARARFGSGAVTRGALLGDTPTGRLESPAPDERTRRG